MSDDGQGFSRLTKLVLVLLALLPVWYLLHQHWDDAARTSIEPVTFSDTVFRIMVGLVGFLAVILLVHGGKPPRKSGEKTQWAACPCCGQRTRYRAEDQGKRITCSACDNDFEYSTLVAAAPVPASDEDITKWAHRLEEQRHRAKGKRH